MSNYDTVSAVDGNDAAVTEIKVHPRLMTHRRSSDSHISSAHQTPRSSRAVPTNAELAHAGVTAQDGVVQQLSARTDEIGSLAGPREVSSQRNSGHQPLTAITACGTIAELPKFGEPHKRPAISNTPREHQHQNHQPQRMRSTSHRGVARNLAGGSSSHEQVRPGHSSRSSTPRLSSKHKDPYAHVTSVVHEYCQNRISALEAQYGVVRSHSNASVSRDCDTRQSQIASPLSAERRYSASAHRRASMRSGDEARQLSSMSSRSRQNSPLPRSVREEYLRGGVPRAALDAPHIRYAEALANRNSCLSPSSARLACMRSMSSNMTTSYVPDVANRIPDRFKYVPPTEEERRRHREETLRALEEWRRRQWASGNASRDGTVDMDAGGAAVESRNGNPTKNQADTRFQKAPPAHSESSASCESWKSQTPQADDENTVRGVPRKGFGNTSDSLSGRAREAFTPSKRRSARKTKNIRDAVVQHDGYSSNGDAGGWQRPQLFAGTRSDTPMSHGRNGTGPRASPRKGRMSPMESARSVEDIKQNSFRRKLLFDVVAPTVSVA
ncbi:hypothetical protein, unknown function [Leishmania tarentolae]|uniref:Uncharacterized protein n=1 Tax=Leishmania tarentolae TaxID=5689 RepID=A0A640L142_LEITA|nr:hypothetical protein, unknown function [Leishmania tarentolae]